MVPFVYNKTALYLVLGGKRNKALECVSHSVRKVENPEFRQAYLLLCEQPSCQMITMDKFQCLWVSVYCLTVIMTAIIFDVLLMK